MVSAKRLAQLVKKWQRMAAMGRKRITHTTTAKRAAEECCKTTSVAVKGHCMVYTSEGVRFEVPLAYLSTTVFGELLRISQEEFGFAGSDDAVSHCPVMPWSWNTPCSCSGEMLPLRLLGRS
uniref:Uncharacterized protein n=1 Tax=Avena sativa TaxID=4498 RepID=A0ACD5YFC0_AVESA